MFNNDKLDKMTSQNLSRYIIKQVKHAIKTQKNMFEAMRLINDYEEVDYCIGCPHEDFGQCYLIHKVGFDEFERVHKHCLPSYLANKNISIKRSEYLGMRYRRCYMTILERL